MAHCRRILFVFIFIACFTFVFGDVGVGNGDRHVMVDGVDVNVDAVIRGDEGSEEFYSLIDSSPNFLDIINRRIASPEGDSKKALNENSELRKKWLGNYGIGDNGGELKLVFKNSEDENGGYMVQVGTEPVTSFSLGDIPVKSISEDGSVSLMDGSSFKGGYFNLDSDSASIIFNDGEVDLTNIDLESTFTYDFSGDVDVIVGSKIVEIRRSTWPITFGKESDGSVEALFADGEITSVKIEEGNIFLNGLFKEGGNVIDGIGKFNSDGRFYIKGLLKDYGSDSKDITDNVLFLSGEDFFRYLDDDSEVIEGENYVLNRKGDFVVSLNSQKEDSIFNILDDGGIQSIEFERKEGPGEILFSRENGEDENRLLIYEGGFSIMGDIVSFDNVNIFNPKSEKLKELPDLVAGVFDENKLAVVNEVKLAKDILSRASEIKNPRAIMISYEDYGGNDEMHSLSGTHEDSDVLAGMLEKSGFSKERIHQMKDMGYDDLISKVKNVISENPSDEYVFFYSGHGVEANGESFLTTKSSRKGEDGRFQDVISFEDINSFGVKNRATIVDACLVGRNCNKLESDLVVSSSGDDEVSMGFKEIKDKYGNKREQSLFFHTLTNPVVDIKNSPGKSISLTDKMILDGFENEWLTRIFSSKIEAGTFQTPKVIVNKLVSVFFFS